MYCLGHEYRVVCSQSQDNKVCIDIVPADNALHQLILKERRQRDSSTRIIAGSIKLYDMGEGRTPEILFLPPENGGLTPVELSKEQENMLRHKIAARFAQMREQNQESTIVVRPEIHREYIDKICAKMISNINISLDAADAPQSLQEERTQKFEEQQKHANVTRIQTQEYLRRRDEKYSKYGLSALQIKQLIHRDY